MLSSSHFHPSFPMSDSDDRCFHLRQNQQDEIQFHLVQIHRIKDRGIELREFEEDEEFHGEIILQLHPDEEIAREESVQGSRREVSLGDLKADEDGFKTPESSDRKVPEVKQCPPAPRKPKPVKRKAPEGNVRRNLRLDLSEEVRSLFPRSILADFNRKIKKARTEDNLKNSL